MKKTVLIIKFFSENLKDIRVVKDKIDLTKITEWLNKNKFIEIWNEIINTSSILKVIKTEIEEKREPIIDDEYEALWAHMYKDIN